MAAVEVEFVEGSKHALGEAGESAPQSVLAREVGAAVGQCGVLGGELLAAGGQGRGASCEFVEVEQVGLVGVEQPMTRWPARQARIPRAIARCVLPVPGD